MKRTDWESLPIRIRALPNLRCLGFQPHEAIDELLSAAHVLVNTSSVEGFSNTFIEAWLREVPVVSLSVNPDGVFDGDRFGICAHESYERLRDGVEGLITDSSFRARMGQRARVFTRERFSERNIEQVSRMISRYVQRFPPLRLSTLARANFTSRCAVDPCARTGSAQAEITMLYHLP